MNNDHRSRALRLASTAILCSVEGIDMSILIAELSKDREFGSDLSRLLTRLNEAMMEEASPPTKKQSDEGGAPPLPLLEVAYLAVQKRRLSKRELVAIMSTSSKQKLGVTANFEKLSVRELIHYFVSRATKPEINTFMRNLGVEVSDDPYLRGIIDPARNQR